LCFLPCYKEACGTLVEQNLKSLIYMGFGGHIKINIFNKFDNFPIGTVNDSVLY
jgi:hypothetical protein